MSVKPCLYTYVSITFLLLFASLTAGAQDFKSEAFLDLDLNGLVAGRLHFPDLPDHMKGEVSFVVYACLDSTGKVTEAKLLEQEQRSLQRLHLAADEKRGLVSGGFLAGVPEPLPAGLAERIVETVRRAPFLPSQLAKRCGTFTVGYLKRDPKLVYNFAHTESISCMQYSPDGNLLATSAGNNCNIRLWDAKQGLLSGILKEPGAGGVAFRFSPDGQFLAAIYSKGLLRIWRVYEGGGHEVSSIQLDQIAAWDLEFGFSPDSKTLVLPAGNNEVLLIDPNNCNILQKLYLEHEDFRRKPDFSPDGRLLLFNEWGQVHILDIATRETLVRLPFRSKYDYAEHAFFSSDGARFYVLEKDEVRVHDALTADSIRQYALPMAGHDFSVRRVPGSRSTIALALNTGQLLLFDLESEKMLRQTPWDDPQRLFALSPDMRQLAAPLEKQGLRFIDGLSGQTRHTVPGGDLGVNSLAFSPDGQLLAVGGKDGSVALWRMDSMHLVRMLSGHRGWVTSLCFSPDGESLLTAGQDSTARVWEVATGELLETIRAHRAELNTVAYAPDGLCFATGGNDHAVWLHGMGDEDFTRSRLLDKDNSQGVYGVQFSPDGSTLITTTVMERVKLWDLKKKRKPKVLLENAGWSKLAKFSSDGKYLLLGQNDKVLVFDLEKNHFTDTIALHNSIVLDAVMTDTIDRYRYIFSVGLDDRLGMYRLGGSGALVELFDFHSGGATSIAFSPGKRWLATGGWDNTIRLFDTLTEQDRYPQWTLYHEGKGSQWLAITHESDFRCSPGMVERLHLMENGKVRPLEKE